MSLREKTNFMMLGWCEERTASRILVEGKEDVITLKLKHNFFAGSGRWYLVTYFYVFGLYLVGFHD